MCEDACPKCISAHVTCKSTYHAETMLGDRWSRGLETPCSKSLQPEKQIWKSIRCWSQLATAPRGWVESLYCLSKRCLDWHHPDTEKTGRLDPSDPGLLISNLSILFGFWGSRPIIRAHCKYSITALLMVQKSQKTTWDEKKLVNNGIIYQLQLVIDGFLNHQQYHWIRVRLQSRPQSLPFRAMVFHGVTWEICCKLRC